MGETQAARSLLATWLPRRCHPSRPSGSAQLRELEAADEYVFGVVMHNFSIPSVLDLWIDQIVRAGRTFSHERGAIAGLLRNKRATFLVASGGVYEPGAFSGGMNFAERGRYGPVPLRSQPGNHPAAGASIDSLPTRAGPRWYLGRAQAWMSGESLSQASLRVFSRSLVISSLHI